MKEYSERTPIGFRFKCPNGKVEETLWSLAELSNEISGSYITGQKITALAAYPYLMSAKNEPIKQMMIKGFCERGVDKLIADTLQGGIRTKIHFVDYSTLEGDEVLAEAKGWAIE